MDIRLCFLDGAALKWILLSDQVIQTASKTPRVASTEEALSTFNYQLGCRVADMSREVVILHEFLEVVG